MTDMKKVTIRGVVLTLKNIGAFLASYQLAGIRADPTSFLFQMVIYACINIPSDLLLMNHWSTDPKPQPTP
jgi:hypothetical protein